MKKYLIIIILFLFILPVVCNATSAILISDQHTGTKKNVKMNMGIFQNKVSEIRDKKPDIIISCGDEAYNGEISMYAIMQKMDGIVWVKGDDDKKYNLSPANYTKDFDDVRVIVLDDSNGKLSGSQINFLKNAEDTEKDVIIAMHVPPLNKNVKPDLKKWKTFYPALTPNVKMVVSGHWHAYRRTTWNGIKFIVVPPMFKGQYLIENL